MCGPNFCCFIKCAKSRDSPFKLKIKIKITWWGIRQAEFPHGVHSSEGVQSSVPPIDTDKKYFNKKDFYKKDFYKKDFNKKDFNKKDFYKKDFYKKDFYKKDFYKKILTKKIFTKYTYNA